MKYTKVVVVCNVCWQATGGDIENPADHTIIFKTSEETDDFFRVDVCQDHATNGTSWDELLRASEPLDPATPLTHRAVGRPRPVSEGKLAAIPCPECRKPFRGRSGLALHMKAKHPEAWAQIVIEREAEAERKNIAALNQQR